MRITAGASIIAVVAVVAAAEAQQSNPPVSAASVRAALQASKQPSLWITPTLPPWVAPGPTRLGILTFYPPDTKGEMVKVMVPVGQLVTSVTQAVSNVQRRRAERKALAEVQRALQDFQTQ